MADICHVCIDRSFVCAVAANGIVHILLGDSMLREQRLIAVPRNLRQFQVRLGRR
jgi:hypothetical protein